MSCSEKTQKFINWGINLIFCLFSKHYPYHLSTVTALFCILRLQGSLIRRSKSWSWSYSCSSSIKNYIALIISCTNLVHCKKIFCHFTEILCSNRRHGFPCNFTDFPVILQKNSMWFYRKIPVSYDAMDVMDFSVKLHVISL